MRDLFVYNSLSRKKEKFQSINSDFVGMYVCGPTVYSDVHLGNVRTFMSFDMMYRYLLHLGYTVRYVRNITDVGHLTDDGEDRMSKGAKKDKLEPMEVAHKYTIGFHDMMRIFNTHSPDIEPRATGHIIEQIEMVQQIIDNGYGYESNGSVYFDVTAFMKDHPYGELSGRVVEDLLVETRDLKNQNEKRSPSDFAIWMKASVDHLMKWNSPWSVGFPGWHLECSAMSTKYLGKHFDIHGGGNDLKFPHHENEIAQNIGACKCSPANYWLHTNMLLMNGKKMSKSDGNTITPIQLFTGESPHVTKGYDPMVVKFFMLQAHYSSTIDLTNDGLLAAEKGYKKLMDAIKVLEGLTSNASSGTIDSEIDPILEAMDHNMSDDFNSPKVIANLFELVAKINGLKGGQLDINQLSKDCLDKTKKAVSAYVYDILGLKDNRVSEGAGDHLEGLMSLILEIRADSRIKKDWDTSDKIRDTLKELQITVKDGKDDTTWSIN